MLSLQIVIALLGKARKWNPRISVRVWNIIDVCRHIIHSVTIVGLIATISVQATIIETDIVVVYNTFMFSVLVIVIINPQVERWLSCVNTAFCTVLLQKMANVGAVGNSRTARQRVAGARGKLEL